MRSRSASLCETSKRSAKLRIRKVLNTKTQEWKRSQENAWFLSTSSLTAEDYMKHIRNHCCIENRKHHVRDLAFKEDNSRIRKNPQIMALTSLFRP